MNPLLEVLLHSSLLFDAIGVLGLGLIGLAAVRLSRTHHSWGGTTIALGAMAILVARSYLVISPYVITDEFLMKIGPFGISLTYGLPPLLLTFGLAGIVWGLWIHQRWLAEGRP